MVPAWTGQISSYEIHSDGGDKTKILKSFEVAEAYLQRIEYERDHFAPGFPADGYGYLGVCNDSNAIIELLTMGTISTYPLVRAAELDEVPLVPVSPALQGMFSLDAAFRQLPHDADCQTSKQDTLRRILAMTPYSLDSPEMVDEELRSQLKLAERDLWKLASTGL